MADVTREVTITPAWVEVSHGLTDGTTYVVDLSGAESRAVVFWAVVDDAGDDPIVGGHPIPPEARRTLAASLEFTPEAGKRLMMRVSIGSTDVILTEL